MLFVWFCVFVSAFTGRFVTEQTPPPPLRPGSSQDVPVNRTDVLEAAQFAVVEFNKANTEDVFDYSILDITTAKVQLVAGLNYYLEMLLGRAACKTGNTAAVKDNAAANDCDSNSEYKELKCTFTVYVIPWQDSRVLLHEECKSTTDSV